MLGTWEKCAARYKYRYIEGLADKSTPFANKGTNAHNVIEKYIKGETIPLEPRMQPMFGLLERLKEVGQPEAWCGVSKEWEKTPYREGWLKAKLDCVEKPDNDEIVVWEWKTGQIYDNHDEQRELYGLVALAQHPKVDTAIVNGYYIDQKHISNATVVRRDKAEPLRKEWETRVGFLESDKIFAPRPGWYCRNCPYSRDAGGPCKVG